MARRRFEKPGGEAELDITSMLDMIFILLIFFIVSTSFIHVSGLNVSRPQASSQKVVKESKIVLIEIQPGGVIVINGRKVGLVAVRAEVEKNLAGKPDAQVVVAASPVSRAGTLVQVIDQARQAGAKKVSIATTES